MSTATPLWREKVSCVDYFQDDEAVGSAARLCACWLLDCTANEGRRAAGLTTPAILAPGYQKQSSVVLAVCPGRFATTRKARIDVGMTFISFAQHELESKVQVDSAFSKDDCVRGIANLTQDCPSKPHLCAVQQSNMVIANEQSPEPSKEHAFAHEASP
jgi:hypothetical protein